MRDVPSEATAPASASAIDEELIGFESESLIGAGKTIWGIIPEEGARLGAVFRGRLLSFGEMSQPLRRLTLLVIAQLVVVALLLATQGVPQPLLYVGVGTDAHAGQIPLVAFIAVEGSLIAGCSLALYGVRLIRARMRLAVLALVTVALAAPPLVQLVASFLVPLQLRQFFVVVLVAWAQIAVLGIFWLRALGRAVGQNWTPEGRRAALEPSPDFDVRSFGGTLAPVLLYGALAVGGAAAYSSLGPTAGSGFIALGIWVQIIMLSVLVAGVVYWLSTDAVEWGTVLAGRVAHGAASLGSRLRRDGDAGLRGQWALVAVAAAAAIGVLGDVAHRYAGASEDARAAGTPAFVSLLLIAGVVAGVAGCAWLAGIDRAWPTDAPRWALLGGAAVVVGVADAAFPLGYWLTTLLGLPIEATAELGRMIERLVVAAAIVGGLLFILHGRGREHNRSLLGLMLVLVGALLLVGMVTAGLLTGLLLVSALATLAVAGLAVSRRGAGRLGALSVLIVQLFFVMAGLETINWYADLADWLSRRGEQSVVLLGMIFLLLILRDVMTSGDLLTGEETPAYPRAGRIALYFGYVVVSSALVLFVGTVHVGDAAPFGGDFASQDLSLDALAQIGLIALGIPVVALTFILRIGQWRAGVPGTRRPATVAAVERTLLARLRTEELGVAVAGLVALGAIVMSGVSSARALSASARQTPASQPAGTYSAPAPGRACDKGNALWTDGARYTCTPVGTSVKVAAHTSGLLAFTPPHGDFAHTYQIAVRVDFRGLDAGCLSVAAGESRTDFDEYALCKGGSWAIRRFTVGSSAPPALVAQGKAPAADSYEFAVRMGASDLRLLINGVAVGGDSHTPLVVRECLLLVSNLGGRAGTVVLSDFVYTPLA